MKIIPPTTCPSCGAYLERQNAQLFCPNNVDCPAQTGKRLQNFCKVLKIKGFGESTLQKLEFSSLNDLVLADKSDFLMAGFSDHMATKLVSAIKERIDAGITIPEFISALSIPLVGNVAASKLQVSKMEDITQSYCKSVGLGDKVTNNLVMWVNTEWPLMAEYWDSKLTKTIKEQKAPTTDIVVCITGKLEGYSRSEAQAHLEALGVTVKSSVTKAVTHLVCDEANSTSSSVTKAKQLNIQIITLRDLEDKLQCQN